MRRGPAWREQHGAVDEARRGTVAMDEALARRQDRKERLDRMQAQRALERSSKADAVPGLELRTQSQVEPVAAVGLGRRPKPEQHERTWHRRPEGQALKG